MTTLHLKGEQVLVFTKRSFRFTGIVENDDTDGFLILREPSGIRQIIQHTEIERVQVLPVKSPPDSERDLPFWEGKR